jgi:hypothetical protein
MSCQDDDAEDFLIIGDTCHRRPFQAPRRGRRVMAFRLID